MATSDIVVQGFLNSAFKSDEQKMTNRVFETVIADRNSERLANSSERVIVLSTHAAELKKLKGKIPSRIYKAQVEAITKLTRRLAE